MSQLAYIFVRESILYIKDNHFKSSLSSWEYLILNHSIFSFMPGVIEASICLSFLADRRVSFLGRIGIHFTHVLRIETELQHNIAVWYHAKRLGFGVRLFSEKRKMSIGPKIAAFDSWFNYLWAVNLSKLFSILRLFSSLLNDDDTDFMGLFWGINEVNKYEKLTTYVFNKCLLILYSFKKLVCNLLALLLWRYYINMSILSLLIHKIEILLLNNS